MRPLALAAAALLGASALLAGSCSENPADSLIPNQPPAIALSAGPIRDSVNVFVVTFNWNASDPDGQVTRFLYAIDDTLSPGAWFETASYELTLLFTAADSAGVDSVFVGLSDVPFERYRYRGAHTFYVRALDDDGARSAPAALSFTAQTFAPESQILNPSPSVLVDLGASFTVSWQGTDPDGTENPVGYSYRIVPVQNVLTLTSAQVESTLYDPAAPGEPWSPFEVRTAVRLANLAIPHDYLFGIRALDQAGAIEPRLRTPSTPGPTNTLRIRASEFGGRPTLCVSSSVKTSCFPTADERRKTFQIPASSNVVFTWEGDASSYGAEIAGYTYGIDLQDPNALDPGDPGWAPESATLTRAVLRFDLPPGSRAEEHLFYVRARDDVGSITIADIALIVVPLSQERDVLLVDDFGRDNTGNMPPDCVPEPPDSLENNGSDFPQDQCHDQFLRQTIRRALAANGHPDWNVDLYDPLDPNGRLILRGVNIDSVHFDHWRYTGPVTLQNLARYKLVIWNVRSEETVQLRKMNLEGEDNFLAVYVESGGPVWIMGTGTFSRTKTRPGGVGLSTFGFEPRDFVYRFLKIESTFEGAECVGGCFRTSGEDPGNQRLNGFDGAYPSRMATAEGYDTLRVARPPYNGPNKGVPSCEGMVVPLGLDMNPRLRLFGGHLDTLYFYQSNNLLQRSNHSYMDHSACALRYSGPGQGRLMMFGFPLYFLSTGQVDRVMEASVRWLLE